MKKTNRLSKRIAALLLAAAMFIAVLPLSASAARFVDVPSSQYYAAAVSWGVENKIIYGADSTHFKPNGKLTRGEVVTFLWRMAGKPTPSTGSPFVDVNKGDYFYSAVIWANRQGIVFGEDAIHFKPNKTCTRADIATFLWRYYGKPTPTSYRIPFVDVKTGYYIDAVVWANENNIVYGEDATHFKPKNTCTRGQGATFLYRANRNVTQGIGLCKDVDWNREGGSVIVNSDGTISMYPAEGYEVETITVNGRPKYFTVEYGWTIISDIKVTDVVRITFKQTGAGGEAGEDNDMTGYVPKGWSWERDGTEGYNLRYFTSGKYVRRDGKAVLYIESSSYGGDNFAFQLYVMAGGGKDAWSVPYSDGPADNYMYAECTGDSSAESESGMERLFDNGSHVITVRAEDRYEDRMPEIYNMPDGEYVLVREK